jgi:hypothetical protein
MLRSREKDLSWPYLIHPVACIWLYPFFSSLISNWTTSSSGQMVSQPDITFFSFPYYNICSSGKVLTNGMWEKESCDNFLLRP